MSGSFTGYNSDGGAINFNERPDMFPSPYGKIAGVGCDGTKSGIDATKPEYSSPFIVGGGNGYSFTNERVPIAGPGAPYSVIEPYNTSNRNYRTDFPKSFPSLVGGSKRRRRHSISRRHRYSRKYRQYGCSKKSKYGGKRRNTSKCGGKRRTRKNRGGFLQLARRGGKRTRKTMRGGMSSAADYTQGRNTSQDQPYGNKAYSFGQGLDTMLSASESALASPPPFLPYDDCGKYTRN